LPLTSSRIGSGTAAFGGATTATGVAAFDAFGAFVALDVFDFVDELDALGAGCAELVADAVGVSVCGYSSTGFAAESASEFLAGDGAEACSTFSGFGVAGASGARVLVTLIYEMIRRDAKRGIAALCLGGGNAVAMAVER
jgi:hypothetical protein